MMPLKSERSLLQRPRASRRPIGWRHAAPRRCPGVSIRLVGDQALSVADWEGAIWWLHGGSGRCRPRGRVVSVEGNRSIVDEPVRGAISDLRGLQRPGLAAARAYVRGELPAPPIWRLLGLQATEAGLGKSTYSMPVTRWLEDPFGIVWAGAFAVLADAPLGSAIWTGLGPGKAVTTSELNLSYVRPFTRETGNIVGRATTVHQGSQVGLSAVEISDRNGRTMGYGTTRCLIMDMPVDPDADYPEPDTGPEDPPDPYLREAPTDSYFDLASVLEGEPIEIQERIFSGEVRPNIGRLLDWTWEPQDPGYARGTLPTSPWFSVGAPTLYGGALAWFLDGAMGSAVYSSLGPGQVFATLDMNVRFTRPAQMNSGDLTAEAHVTHMGRRLRIAQAELVGSDGKRVAMATSSALVVEGGIKALMQGWVPDEVLRA